MPFRLFFHKENLCELKALTRNIETCVCMKKRKQPYKTTGNVSVGGDSLKVVSVVLSKELNTVCTGNMVGL